uniref:Outer membrane protein (Porin) n=1 Tax=Candidatus Kentrum sp. TUN TaxID=2126343 RepID=A0A450ZJS3_9GAMM|nr:MAG: Outer membrane protein (porin) [Candidatus Kentron sp. TUN]VFK54014.1 MAG: Outer membrane protein (porin) [Candidatus Kentron sp. TUN]
MQKKLLSLAIASALALPGVAMADVKGHDMTVYGKFHASWDFVDNEAAGDDFDDNTAAFRNSRLGFKGSEKLGGNSGLQAVWQIETLVNTGGDNVSLRNTFVGLEGHNWGTVAFGKHDTPYKTATAALDIFSDTIADYNNIIGAHITDTGTVSSNFNERENQVVMYQTPKKLKDSSGFSAQIARGSVQNAEDTGLEEQEAWSAMGMYEKGYKDKKSKTGYFASLGYELYKGGMKLGTTPPTTTTDSDIDALKLGLGYKWHNSKFSFVYEDIERDGSLAADKQATRDAFSINFAHDFGNNTFKLAYAKANDSDASGSDDGADNWSLGLDHHFSDRTKIYGIYTHLGNDTNANYSLYSAQNVGSKYDGAGKDISAFSLGIIHNF